MHQNLDKFPPAPAVCEVKGRSTKIDRIAHRAALLVAMLGEAACINQARPELPSYAPTCESSSSPEKFRADKPLLASLRDKQVFKHPWTVTASSEVFHGLGKKFCEDPAAKELCQKSTLKVLYPASGVLLSPLDLGFALAEKSDQLTQLEFTYTEIDEKSYAEIDTVVRQMVENLPGLSNLQVSEHHLGRKKHPQRELDPKLKLINFSYQTSAGRCVIVTIRFEYQMSELTPSGYPDFFRPESAAEADIWISHDMSNDGEDSPYEALSTYLSAIRPAEFTKPHFLIMEYRDRYKLSPRFTADWQERHEVHAPGSRTYYENLGQPLFIQEGAYGCGANPRARAKINQAITSFVLDFYSLALLENPDIAASISDHLSNQSPYLMPVENVESELEKLRAEGISPFKTHLRALMVAHQLAQSNQNLDLQGKLRKIVSSYLATLRSSTLQQELGSLAASAEENILEMEVMEDGFFYAIDPLAYSSPDYTNRGKRLILAESLLTLLYIGKALGCPEIASICGHPEVIGSSKTTDELIAQFRKRLIEKGRLESHVNAVPYQTIGQVMAEECFQSRPNQ